MEIEGSQGKKVWNMVRVLYLMLRKGIAKSKIMVEFHLMVKRGKLAGKALVNTLMIHHQYYTTTFTCRSHNTFISPSPRECEYEFSCSNSPAKPFKRKHHHHHHRFSKSSQYDDVSTLSAVQKVLEMLNNDKVEPYSNSPLITLPGFGKSPIGKQLRVTDSPFPLKDEGDSQVDMAAEEFINKFYKDLNLQKRMSALESPYHKIIKN